MSTLSEGDCVFRESDANGPGWSLFRQPKLVEGTGQMNEVEPILRRAEAFVQSGGYAVVAISFDAATAFDSALTARQSANGGLAWSAHFEKPPSRFRELAPVYDAPIGLHDPAWSLSEYSIAFEAVKSALERGDSYQINLTFPQSFNLKCSPEEFFANRCGVDPPPYAAFLHAGESSIASFSPELLFERIGDRIRTKPMKGTAIAPSRRPDLLAAMASLTSDAKIIAENVMIVDMARNDLGAVCEFGSVQTTSLLRAEKHRNLLQVTSTVEGTTEEPLWDVLKALFPAASVTGAPKVQTMRLIEEIESSPRGIYCGTIGLLTPESQRFSVAIRTAEIDRSSGNGVFGIGSGIVWDSNADDEYAESLAKRDRLVKPGEQWALRDAIAVDRIEDAQRLNLHLDRLEDNARFFDVPFDRAAIAADLRNFVTGPASAREKVRIWLDRNGKWEMTRLPSVVESNVMRVALANEPVSSKDVNLQRKTTSRAMLDDARDQRPEFDDVLLYNEFGHLTEFGFANVVVEREAKKYTPHVEDGCLAGIGVLEMIERGEVERAHIPLSWLDQGAEVWYVNSVAGLVRAELHSTKPGKSDEISYSNP